MTMSFLVQYWEDEADLIREQEGTLLPLWTFNCSQGRQKQACASSIPIAWQKWYSVFLVGLKQWSALDLFLHMPLNLVL